MEGLGAEVTQKIRSAIQAKLMELGAYVDEELPDYVMVMVGNKRSRSQMENDLQLFLGNNTVPFTTWLYQVLQKLQEVTVANKASAKPKKRDRTPSMEEDHDFLNIKAEIDGDIIEEEPETKKKTKPEKVTYTPTSKSNDKPLEYQPTKLKDKKVEETNEKKVNKSKDSGTVKKKGQESEGTKKQNEIAKRDEVPRKEDIRRDDSKEVRKRRSHSGSPVKEKSRERIIYDAREVLNRKKAEKSTSKEGTKYNDVKRKRDRSTSVDKYGKRRVHGNDDVGRTLSRDSDRQRSTRDSSLKSTVHRTALKRKSSRDEDKFEERSDRWKDEKRSEPYRPSKIRISEMVREEEELLKPRGSKSNTNLSERGERWTTRTRLNSKDSSRDSEEKEKDGVSSVVRVTPRPKRPASSQPSSSLILKAVAEANKSLASAPPRHQAAMDADSSGDGTKSQTVEANPETTDSDNDDSDDSRTVVNHAKAVSVLRTAVKYLKQENASTTDLTLLEKWLKYSIEHSGM